MAVIAVQNLWYAVSAVSALALVVLLLCRHVFESRLGPRTRTALNLALLPLLLVFLTYIAAGPLL